MTTKHCLHYYPENSKINSPVINKIIRNAFLGEIILYYHYLRPKGKLGEVYKEISLYYIRH